MDRALTSPMITGRDKATFHKNYLALAKRDPDDGAITEALSAGLASKLPSRTIDYFNPQRDIKRNKPLLDRIAALAARTPHPATAAALVTLLEHPPVSVEDQAGVYGPAVELLGRIGDGAALARLRQLRAHPIAKTAMMRDYLELALPRAIAAIEKRGIKAAKAPRAKAAPPGRDLSTLLAECLANPFDDGPRLVYADALLEAGDPRGEMIQLQLAPVEDRKRVAQLVRKHDKEWLGDIARVTKLRVWRRGFLDEAELLQGAAADPATWRRVTQDPRMATVRTLHKGTASEELYLTFAMSPALVGLRDVVVPSLRALAKLATCSRPLDRLVLTMAFSPSTMRVALDTAKATGARRLAFKCTQSPAQLLALLEGWPGLAQFDELVALPPFRAGGWNTDDDRWRFAFDRLAPVTAIGCGVRDDHVVLAKGTAGAWRIRAQMTHEGTLASIVRTLGKKPRVEHLAIHGVPRSWSRVTAALRAAITALAPTTLEVHDGWTDHVAPPSRRGRT